MLLPLALLALSQVPLPEQPGPRAVSTATNLTIPVAGRMVSADLYTPSDAAGAPYPVVVIGHGFARNKDNVAGHAAHLASWGMVVLAPTFPGAIAPDHALNGRIMRELMLWARGGPAPIGAIADATRGAYVGHSAGGLAALLAAADDPTVSALVGLDPVDNNGLGAGRASSVRAASLVLAAAPSRCNASASADDLYAALRGPSRWFLRVVGATHCDGEDPSNRLCTSTCGGEDAARRALFRRYMTAHLRAVFECAALEHLPGGTALAQQLMGGSVAELDGSYACGGAVDAGVRQDAQPAPDAQLLLDAGANDDAALAADASVELDATTGPDAASGEDAAATPDAEAPSGDASAAVADAGTREDAAVDAGAAPLPTSESSGCGCGTASGAEGALGLACVIALALSRGSHRRKKISRRFSAAR